MNDFNVVVSEDVFNGFRQCGMKGECDTEGWLWLDEFIELRMRHVCGWVGMLTVDLIHDK